MTDDPDHHIKPTFNRLSWGSQWKLRFAAVLEAKTDFVRDDVREHPWRFPFYAAYMSVYILGMGATALAWGAVTIPILMAVAKYVPSRWSDKARARFSDLFNEKAMDGLTEKYSHCLEYIPPSAPGEKSGSLMSRWLTWSYEPDSFHLKTWPLCRDAGKSAWGGIVDSYRIWRGNDKPPPGPG